MFISFDTQYHGWTSEPVLHNRFGWVTYFERVRVWPLTKAQVIATIGRNMTYDEVVEINWQDVNYPTDLKSLLLIATTFYPTPWTLEDDQLRDRNFLPITLEKPILQLLLAGSSEVENGL